MFVNPLGPSLNPYGTPMMSPPVPNPVVPDKDPDIPRYINFLADYTGCGHWRMLWPEQVLNVYRQCVIQSTTVMITDPRYFTDVSCIRVQRQCTPGQKKYIEHLKSTTNARLVYDIDDICFGEDIPDYNPFKYAFIKPETRQCIQDIMEMCDEMTVTCDRMKQYFLNKTNQKNITVLPNRAPKFWIGNLYDKKHVSSCYDKFRKKPRVLYAGSSSHFDIKQKNKHQDDLSHVIQAIVATADKLQWVFLGGVPNQLKPLVEKGLVEYHKWSHMYDYPYQLKKLNINIGVIPLMDNIFNRCKSDIKYIEYSALGIPAVCQDIDVYKRCKHTFNSGSEMVNSINKIMSSKKQYMSIVERNYNSINNLWLENEQQRETFNEIYKHEYGNPGRVNINKLNDI
jgi:glycosyltransferase involved in cell wall biosynthesis